MRLSLLEGFRYTLFHAEDGAFRVHAQEGYPPGYVHDFLEDPDAWADALRSGAACVHERDGLETWVVADPPGRPLRLLVVELPTGGAGMILLRAMRLAPADQPSWVEAVVPLLEKAGSPFLMEVEAGCYPDRIIQAFLERRVGSSAAEFFAPARLSRPVQLRELFGDRAGARLGGAGGEPFVERAAGAHVIREAADLDLEAQRRLLDLFSAGVSGVWILYTSRDLRAMAEEGGFARGFMEFLWPGKVSIPPLRSFLQHLRGECDRILAEMARRYHRAVSLTEPAYRVLAGYDWPGNWAELEAVLETAYFMSREQIDVGSLALGRVPVLSPDSLDFRQRAAELERRLLLEAYALHAGNQVHMARALGISRGSLQYQMAKYGLQPG